MRFIAFDLETTGFLPGVDRIVEVGAVRFINGEIDGIFSTLVDPCQPIPSAASAVNGISDEMVVGQPKIEHLLEPLAEFCGEDMLIAHNAAFDFQFLSSEFQRCETRTPRGSVLCSFLMSKKVFPGLANYKLGTLVQHLSIEAAEFHRAEADATYCAHVFLKIVERIGHSHFNPPPLANLIALTGKNEVRFPVIEPQPKQLTFF